MLLLTGSLCPVFSLSTLPSNRSTLLTERVDPVAFLLRTSQSVIGPRPLAVVIENGVTLAVGQLGPLCVTDATCLCWCCGFHQTPRLECPEVLDKRT